MPTSSRRGWPARGSSSVEWRAWPEWRPTPRGPRRPSPGRPATSPPLPARDDPEAVDPGSAHAAWAADGAWVETDNELVDLAIQRGIDDLCLLMNTLPDGERYVAAGVPWFCTLFGRDAILTGIETVAIRPAIAAATLRILARRQATMEDDAADATPGKILHELRTGEMARSGELPFAAYYGSVDATPLWLILLGEYHDWTADDDLVDELWPNALAALEWLERWGDRDGDGLVEYLRRAPTVCGTRLEGGLHPPSRRSHRGAADTLASQGCVRRRRRLAVWPVAGARRPDVSTAAAALQARFFRRFWVPDRGFLAMAIVMVDPVSHRLRTPGISLDRHHARRPLGRRSEPAARGGHGLGLGSGPTPPASPATTHSAITGAVWPHDTALAVAGLKRWDADAGPGGWPTPVRCRAAPRLPSAELLCGSTVNRRADRSVPGRLSPQAWAASVPLFWSGPGRASGRRDGQVARARPTPAARRGGQARDAVWVGRRADLLIHRWRAGQRRGPPEGRRW
jgi:hypothetical protein